MLEAELEKNLNFTCPVDKGVKSKITGVQALDPSRSLTPSLGARLGKRSVFILDLRLNDPAMFGHDHFVDNNCRQSSTSVKET